MKMTMVERLRSLFQEPFEAVRRMGVQKGMKVADLGAGQGYFTMPSAVVVGDGGLIFAVEPAPDRSSRIRARAAAEGLKNVRVLATKVENLGEIPSGTVDLAFSAFSFHHFEDRNAALGETTSILRDGGTFYLWDLAPGRVVKWGTSPADLQQISPGFSRFEEMGTGRTVRARFVK